VDLSALRDWPPLALLGIVAVLALMAIVIALLVALRRSSDARRAAERQAIVAMEASARPVRRLEQDLNFLFEFFQVFSQLLGELHAEKQLRMIPKALLTAMVRIFRSEVAAVLVRRRGSPGPAADGDQLVVAALHSSQRGIKEGMIFNFGEGQAGVVAERQRVMIRDDFELDRAFRYELTRQAGEPNYDILAPMVAGDDTIGVLAIARPERHHDREREVLEMIARLGALTWKNVEILQQTKSAADLDKLTGILNKGALLDQLSRLLIRAREKNARVSIFMFDLDHFKHYNDSHGHLAGDHLLRQLAALVRDNVRSEDVFGRFGGEEFLLVMPGLGAAQAMNAAGVIRRRIEEFAFEGEETQPMGRVTISGGVACFPDDEREQVELLRAADAALYRAKHGGRNHVMRADDSGLNPVTTRSEKSPEPAVADERGGGRINLDDLDDLDSLLRGDLS
jgi:diguanylate cyclase (GGDEF)-like protein